MNEPKELSELFPGSSAPFFNAESLGSKIKNYYVAWIDLMGAKGIMGRSLHNAANYIGKIHISALMASKEGEVDVYPVIDGCYIIASKRADLERAMSDAMQRLAGVFVLESDQSKRFLVRGGVAAGRLVLGHELAECSKTLSERSDYSNCLALGTAVGQAYVAESKAPPFGFWVDITARSFKSSETQPFTETLWRWWTGTGDAGVQRRKLVGEQLMLYFDWVDRNRRALEYDEDRIREHRAAAKEYFRVGE